MNWEPAILSGFGRASAAEGFLLRPKTAEETAQAFDLARREGRRIVLRGAGRSYGDAAILPDSLALDFTGFNRILEWDPATGLLDAEPGVTIGQLWRRGLPDGWWPPVVSGTMFPTLGGALAMNIHGKNAFREGTLGEHVEELDVLFPTGELRTLSPRDELFYAVISSAGLLGAIVRARLRMKRVSSGLLEVHPVRTKDWEASFQAFSDWRDRADYMVAWIDAFSAGRGEFHAARYVDEPDSSSLSEAAQDLPDRILGIVPKSQVWRALKLFNRRAGMRALNAAKFAAARRESPYRQSLVAFSFLLDYVPGWERSYQPHGFIQYQSFVPAEHAAAVFREQIELQQSERMENYLSVMKLHRPDRFLFSHGVEGYSLAMDFKVPNSGFGKLERLCHRMNGLVLGAGGRFYFAKDSTLRPSDVASYLGKDTLARFRELKAQIDPEYLLTSALARRTGLDPV